MYMCIHGGGGGSFIQNTSVFLYVHVVGTNCILWTVYLLPRVYLLGLPFAWLCSAHTFLYVYTYSIPNMDIYMLIPIMDMEGVM